MALRGSSTILSTGFVTVTIYGGVSTNTYTTTITDSGIYSPASITALSWPSPTTTEPIEYTSFPIQTDPASKYFLGQLPIFVVTEVDGVVVNTAGQPITTIVEVQAQSAYVLYNPAPVNTGMECTANVYKCWSTGQKAGIILAIILGGLLILIFLVWFCCFMRIPRSRKPDEEERYSIRARDRDQGLDGDGGGRRKRVRNPDLYSAAKQGRKRIKRKHSSLSSGSSPEPPKPLPRIVMAEDNREIRKVSSMPQHVLSSEASSGSTGRRAVIGVRVRDSLKDGMLLPSAAACDTTIVLNTMRASNAVTIPVTAARARADLDIPQREIRRDSGKHANIDQKQRGGSRIPKRSSSGVSARPQSYSAHHRPYPPPTDNRNSFPPDIPTVVANIERLGEQLEDGSYHNDQRQSRDFTAEFAACSNRKFLEDRRARRQHRDIFQSDRPQRAEAFNRKLI